jgi:hypothetical protein
MGSRHLYWILTGPSFAVQKPLTHKQKNNHYVFGGAMQCMHIVDFLSLEPSWLFLILSRAQTHSIFPYFYLFKYIYIKESEMWRIPPVGKIRLLGKTAGMLFPI